MFLKQIIYQLPLVLKYVFVSFGVPTVVNASVRQGFEMFSPFLFLVVTSSQRDRRLLCQMSNNNTLLEECHCGNTERSILYS
jgi:hypothetical protein